MSDNLNRFLILYTLALTIILAAIVLALAADVDRLKRIGRPQVVPFIPLKKRGAEPTFADPAPFPPDPLAG